jgi:transposase-like protein
VFWFNKTEAKEETSKIKKREVFKQQTKQAENTPAEFKREVWELITKQRSSTAEAARKPGIRRNMLHRW